MFISFLNIIIYLKGGVIRINIVWNCDLDRNFDECLPQYFFERYDIKFTAGSGRASPASGFNFR